MGELCVARLGILMFALFPSFSLARVQIIESEVGKSFEIRRTYETFSESGSDSSGGSSGHTTILERVIAERDGGLELEFDLTADATKADRAREWQLPTRVFRSAGGTLTLLNRAALEARINRWLRSTKTDRRACGSWYVTWTAFKVECDPDSVLKTLASLDIRGSDLIEGQPHGGDGARGTAPLKKVKSFAGEFSLAIVLELDPEAYRSDRAEADVFLAQMKGEKLTRDEAVRRQSAILVNGTVEVQIDLDANSRRIVRRTTVTDLNAHSVEGVNEKRLSKVTIERRAIR